MGFVANGSGGRGGNVSAAAVVPAFASASATAKAA
jgi:hypothetical protein